MYQRVSAGFATAIGTYPRHCVDSVSLIIDVIESGSKVASFRVDRAYQDDTKRTTRYLVVEAVQHVPALAPSST